MPILAAGSQAASWGIMVLYVVLIIGFMYFLAIKPQKKQQKAQQQLMDSIEIGDYVLTGGELAAAVMADAIVRIIPGVISDEQSALSDSFQDNLLAAPVYTRPADYKGWKVPDILLSGHEAKIKEWELQQSLERTRKLRPDLLGE